MTRENIEMHSLDAEALQDLVARLRIAHHISGRIRLKLEMALTAAHEGAIVEARRLFKALDRAPGIRSASLNVLARSCTVEYDPKLIPPAAWRDLIEGEPTPEAAALLDVLSSKYRELTGS